MIGDQPIPVFETGQISLSCTPHQPRLRGLGAHNGNRTRDLALTKGTLYLLSHVGNLL